MRLGFGTTVLERGISQGYMDGIGVYAKNLWEAFETAGGDLSVDRQAVSFGKNNSSTAAQMQLGETIHLPLSYPLQSARSIVSGQAFSGIRSVEEKIDLFFAPDHHIPRLNHTPVIATIMDAYPLIHPELVSRRLRRFKNFAFKHASHWADHIITISEYSKQDIGRYFDIPEERISVIPLGVNRQFLEVVPEATRESVCRKFGLNEKFFIFVGTIQPRKNLAKLIEAYESLPSDLRAEHHLLIVGHYGWGEERLWQRLNKAEASGTIHHLQNISDRELYALLQSALALVYPSLYEGFGLPVLEGFASRIPVITSPGTSIPEVAADAALYANPLESSEIAARMQSVAADEALRRTLIEKGLQRVARYSWERSAEEHLKLFGDFYRE